MPAVKVFENIYWVGAIDWDIRNFHGYRTPQGTSYNAYLVIDEKITLIDTVKAPFFEEMLANISEIIDPAKIDYHISNHTELDHSGALPMISKLTPNAEILASPNGIKGLTAYYGVLPNMRAVNTGDTLKTGKFEFTFVLNPMVHWPDSMSSYLAAEGILFSNDALGQHIACSQRFDDEIGVDRLIERAGDFYANIVLPLGPLVNKLLEVVTGLPKLDMIAPSHGVILRSHIGDMAKKYSQWANNETNDKKAVIVYDTMWGSTKTLAMRIAADYAKRGINYKLMNMANTHISEVMTELLEARYIAIGSSTINRGVMPTVAAMLNYIKGLQPLKRVGRAFGSYGWSGESVAHIEEVMKALKWELEEPMKVNWKP